MYSPRKGTIRGPSTPSASRDIRSACSPAQITRRSTRCACPAVATSIASPCRVTPVTGVDSRMRPPAASMSSAYARGDGDVVGDRGGRGVQGGQAGGVRLHLGDAGAVDAAQPRHPVLPRGRLQLVEPAHLGGVHRDDELAALLVGQLALRAVLAQQRAPERAQLGLEAARPVVDAGVHDAGVVPRLVPAEPVLRLEDHDLGPRMAQGELAADGQPDDAAADDPEKVASSPDQCRAIPDVPQAVWPRPPATNP